MFTIPLESGGVVALADDDAAKFIKCLVADNAKLREALTDALYASDIIDGFVCGCGFVEPKDYSNYKEAHARIEAAQRALPKAQEDK